MKIGDITNEIKKRNPKAYEEFKQDLAFHVGHMVSLARMTMGMTQAELAEKINTKQPAIARIESGSSLPSLTVLDKIAKLGFGSYLISPQFAFMNATSLKTEGNINFVTGNKTATMTSKIPSAYIYSPSSGVTAKIDNPHQIFA